MNKVILVLSDALRYDVAKANMGFLGHLVETKQASLYKIIGELPSMSRPMYETIHTGIPSSEHGIVANSIVRLSNKSNIFQSVKDAGKTTAAVAYYWYSELYNRAPFDPIDDREVDDENLTIQHGRFYTQDEYPDIELFTVRRILSANIPLIIFCCIPWAWTIMARPLAQIPKNIATMPFIRMQNSRRFSWNGASWDTQFLSRVIMASMPMGAHGGTTPEQREVPFYVIQPSRSGRGDTDEIVSHLQIAPTVLIC
jgi:hypothetical protein